MYQNICTFVRCTTKHLNQQNFELLWFEILEGVNDTCCKRSTFSIMSFSRISKLRSVESCPDVSQRCNDCSLRQSPISFAHKAFWCKIRSQKLANSACVNSSRQISAQSESNLTPDCLCSLVRFPQIFQSFTLTKLDRLSTVDLHTRLYRTSNKLSSG